DREMKRLGPKNPEFLNRQEAQFAGHGKGSLFSLAELEACVDRPMRRGTGWKRRVGGDVAGLARDETSVAMIEGRAVLEISAWQGIGLMESVGNVVKILRDFRPAEDCIGVDRPGIGEGMISRLRELKFKVKAFNPGARANNNEEYENFKTEVAFG